MTCAGALERYETAIQAQDAPTQLIARSLAMLSGVVPARWIGWFPVTPRGDELPGNVALLTGPLRSSPEEGRREYAVRYYRDDPFAPRRHLDGRHSLVTMDDIGGAEGLARTDYGRELLPELGLSHEAAIYLRDGGTMLGFIGFARAPEEGEFTPRELAFLQRTQGFVQLAYRLAHRERPALERADLLEENLLTPREAEVARLAATGATNSQISATLLVSVATVKTHLVRIFAKLGIANRTQLARLLSPTSQDQPFD